MIERRRAAAADRSDRPDPGERGSILILILGFAVVAIMAIGVLASATGLYLAERRLVSIADAAALAAAESYDLDTAVVQGGTVSASLAPADVEASARSYVDRLGADRFEALELVSATSPDGRGAEVTVRAVWRPPILGELLPARVELRATGEARAALG